MISARTKAALAAAKRRGVKLGGDRGTRLTAKARAAGNAAQQAKAQERASDLADTVKELQAAGSESLRAIATELDARGIPAARGGKWSAVQVSRLLERLQPRPFAASAAGGLQ
jgi:DNA invertase Pin-like site-specific DNA recombinase